MKRIITAAIIAVIVAGTHPALNRLAVESRGYDAFGGEDLVLAFGIVIAILILVSGTDKKRGAARPKANRPTTESEHSDKHYDA